MIDLRELWLDIASEKMEMIVSRNVQVLWWIMDVCLVGW